MSNLKFHYPTIESVVEQLQKMADSAYMNARNSVTKRDEAREMGRCVAFKEAIKIVADYRSQQAEGE